jgi:quinol monooxygenase YgiN
MIYVVATSQVKPESRDAFIKGAQECIAATRKEKGCISYDSHTSINDPNLFVVVERWETREDLNAHGRGAAHESLARICCAAEGIADRDRDHQRRQGREAVSMSA